MVGLVDCNNFYASCERLFQPHLRRAAIVVLSNNDGCVIARSNEAKALGIRMGVPAYQVEGLLRQHRVTVFSSNYALYGDMSARVMTVLSRFTPSLEVYSIDEAFLDLKNMVFTELGAYVSGIKQTVEQWCGIPVGIGVGSTKSLAKAANKYAKKMCPQQGFFVIDTDTKRQQVLGWLPVGEIWGVGRQYAKALEQQGIRTALDFAQANRMWVQKRMGVVGARLQLELNGISCQDLEVETPSRKGICTSRSFGNLVGDKEVLMQAVASFATRCAEKLRAQKSCAGNIHVFIHTSAFRTQDEQHHASMSIPLLTPTSSTGELVKWARIAVDRMFRPGVPYKKAGVILTDIVPATQVQGSVFDRADREKESRVAAVMDEINKAMGKDKIRLASAGYNPSWKLKQERISPCYTTDINELLRVRI